MRERLKEKEAHRLPYTAIKNLRTGEAPSVWDVRDIDPTLDDEQTANATAEYFNAISSEFRPLEQKYIPLSWDKHYPFLLPYEVSKRLKDYKKPKSMTAGDIFPQLVTAFSDLIPVPLTKIFNLILWTYH